MIVDLEAMKPQPMTFESLGKEQEQEQEQQQVPPPKVEGDWIGELAATSLCTRLALWSALYDGCTVGNDQLDRIAQRGVPGLVEALSDLSAKVKREEEQDDKDKDKD